MVCHSLSRTHPTNLPSFTEYVVKCTVDAVDHAMHRPSTSTHTLGPDSQSSKYAPFTEFVANVIYRSEIKTATALIALTYIARARPSLNIALEQWACERVFLGAIILAAKVRGLSLFPFDIKLTFSQYSNDATLKNAHWALCSSVFGRRDVGRIEREFLDVLNFDLSIHEAELLVHHDAVVPPPTFTSFLPISASSPMMIPTHKRRRSSTVSEQSSAVSEEVSSWSDDEDSESSGSSAYSPPTPPSSFHEERCTKRMRSSFLPSRPARPNMDHTLPGALELLKSFPIPVSWSFVDTTATKGCKPSTGYSQYMPPAAQLWV